MTTKKELKEAGEFIGITWLLGRVFSQKKYRDLMDDFIKSLKS